MSQYSFYFSDVYPTNQYDEDNLIKYKNLSSDSNNTTNTDRFSIKTILFGSKDDTETINLSQHSNIQNNNNSFCNKLKKYFCCFRK